MKPTDFEKLVVRTPSGMCLARPTLSLFLYSAVPVHELAVRIADAIEMYLRFIGPDVLRKYVGNNGEIRNLTPKRVQKDLAQLRNFPKELGAAWIEYDSDPKGEVGEYGVLVYALDFKGDFERESNNLVRFDFPWTTGTDATDKFIALLSDIAGAFPFESGNAGYTFKRTSASKQAATIPVNQMLPRYLAFDPCYQGVQDTMRGHTYIAHWINLVGDALLAQLGGMEALESQLSGAEVRAVNGGVVIRGAELPPIGDVNRRAPDIGLLPDVARFLAPRRTRLKRLGSPDFDAEAWLARFDEKKSGRWQSS